MRLGLYTMLNACDVEQEEKLKCEYTPRLGNGSCLSSEDALMTSAKDSHNQKLASKDNVNCTSDDSRKLCAKLLLSPPRKDIFVARLQNFC